MNSFVIARAVGLIALGLAAMSGGVFGTLAWRMRPEVPKTMPGPTGPAYVAVVDAASAETHKIWSEPGPPRRGPEWRYDLFTPPEIFYDAGSGKFTVRPLFKPAEKTPEEPFDLELVGVRREPFRLQLIGHVGDGAEARGVFENRVTGEVFLAAAGRLVADLGLRIETFDVRLETVVIPDSMTVAQRVATATVCEENSTSRVTLTERERQFASEIVAMVASEADASPRSVRTGDRLKISGASYRVGQVEADPPRAEIVRTAPFLKEPDRRILVLRSASPTATPVP